MPTPNQAFFDIAARHGDVDVSDPGAVEHWFTETLPTLPPAEIEQILEELLASQTTGVPDADDAPVHPRSYPDDARLPSLDESPPAPVPFLAAAWVDWITKRLSKRRGRGESR